MVMQTAPGKRRMYTSKGALEKVVKKTRPASIYDPSSLRGSKGSAPNRSEARPLPLQAGGGGIGQSSGVGGRLSAGSPAFTGQTSSVGSRLSATPSVHPDPAGAISAGMRPPKTPPGLQGSSRSLPYDRLEGEIRSRLPGGQELASPMPVSTAPRAGVQMGGAGPTSRSEYMQSLGFLPMGQTQYDFARMAAPETATTPGFIGLGEAPPMSVGPFQTSGQLGVTDLGDSLATAQNLAAQVQAQQGMQQSEAGRSFNVPLSQDGGDESGTYEKTVYSDQGDIDLSSPEAETEALEPSDEEKYRSEAKIRLNSAITDRAYADGIDTDERDFLLARYGEDMEHLDRLVDKGFTTYQEALWLFENNMYVSKEGLVRRFDGDYTQTGGFTDSVVLNLEPGEKGRTVSHEELAKELGITALTENQRTGTYDPKYGATGLGGPDGSSDPNAGGMGEYGFPEGSWEDEMYKAMYENPMPQHSEEDIDASKRAVQESNRGVYMDAMRAAAYQNQMMGGSADALMGTQADMMRRVSAQNAQQQMAREFQLRDENYRSQIMEAQKKHGVLMDIASKHWGKEAGDLAYARAKEMDRLRMGLQKDYAQWADENLGPAWYESLAGGLGQTAAQVGGGLGFLKLASMMGLAAPAALASDKRLKKNIRKANISPFKRNGYKPDAYTWEWNDIAKKLYGYVGSSFGVIAQEVEKIIPEAVSFDKNGYRRVNYAMLQEA